jgi:hypothetical protein
MTHLCHLWMLGTPVERSRFAAAAKAWFLRLRTSRAGGLILHWRLAENSINNEIAHMLEIQDDVRMCLAPGGGGKEYLKSIPFGSRPTLTGVYAGQGEISKAACDID